MTIDTQTALVLGTNAGQADLIRHLKDTGWRVIGCSGAVGEAGQALCDLFVHVDIRDVDALTRVAQEHQPDLIYSVSSDLAMKSVVSLAERLDKPRYFDSNFINLLDDKAALRAFLNQHDLSPVGYSQISTPDEVSEWNHFPCVVKPTDGQGQRGVQKIYNQSQLQTAVTKAIAFSRSGQAIVEEFLEGVEISCNVFIGDGIPRVQVLSERLVHEIEQIGIPRGHLVPVQNISAEDEDKAMRLVSQTVAALKLGSGPLYFQMIVTEQGPRIVEIAPRLDGCHMWRIVHEATGVNLIDLCVRGLTQQNQNCPRTVLTVQRDMAPLELMFQQISPNIAFSRLNFPVPSDAIHHEYRYHDGNSVTPINGTLEVVGYYIRAHTS